MGPVLPSCEIGAKKRTKAPARCQPRTLRPALSFAPFLLTPLSALPERGFSAWRISVIFESFAGHVMS
jgi:hypothetical protein